MKKLSRDLAFFCETTQKVLSGIVGIYVDHIVATGNEDFEEKSKVSEKRFESKLRTYVGFVFVGITIGKTNDRYLLHQSSHDGKLKELEMDCSFEDFTVRRYELVWINHMRPDLCASVAWLLQATDGRLDRKATMLLNKTVQKD